MPLSTFTSSKKVRQAQSPQGQGTPQASPSSSEALPSPSLLTQIGWTQAGLTVGDALEALRTASTFTDREMSYDYRNIGTQTNHSGTLTSSTFLLTPGGKVRFAHNDVRLINNVLYDRIQTKKIIQQIVSAQPSLIHFQRTFIQGHASLFAWVHVTFELLQSQIDPTTGTRTEHLDSDATTGQPRLHQMAVLLLRVPPQNQGGQAPMGGTGWLVNTYALDANTLPAIATDPAL